MQQGNKMNKIPTIGTALALCALSMASCKSPNGLFSNYERPDSLSVPDALFRDTVSDSPLVGDTASFGNTPWREVFTDPRLQSLIEKALTANTDLREADLTVRQAEQSLKVARLAFFPSISLSPQGTLSSWDFSKATKTYSVPLQASWQIDAFGTLRNTKKQSQMSLYATRATRQATQTALIASVANLYYTLEMLDAQIRTTEETAELWNKNVEAMEVMYEAALTTAPALSQARANRLSILNTLPTLRNSVRQTENSLCAILHETSHTIARGNIEEAQLPEQFSAGVPLQLLSNRPDVRAAELQMAYAYYGVLGARGNFYPQITLSGSGAWTNSSGMGIVNPGKILASAVGSLVQPIFQNGKLRANLQIAKIAQEKAQLDFEQKLLDAGNEVSNALSSYQAARLRIAGEEELVAQLQQTVDDTQYTFQHDNSVSYIETLTAQQSLLQAQLDLISDKLDAIQAVISLYEALGGGR